MKAVLILAVFALACQAHFDAAEFYRGVIFNLPMETEAKNIIMNNGLDCVNWGFNAAAAYTQTIIEHIQNKDLLGLLRDYEGAKQLLQTTVGPKCNVVAQQLAVFFGQWAATHEQPNFYGSAYPFYHAALIQHTGRALQQLAMGETFAAGNEVGTIIRIITGMEKPVVPQTAEFTFEKWTKFDEQKFVAQFAAGLSNSLSIHNETIAVEATKTMLELVNTINEFEFSPAFKSDSLLVKLQAIAAFIQKVTETINNCPVHKEIVRSIAPTFKAHPGLASLQVIFNIVLENPTVIQNYMNIVINSIIGEYQLAGQSLGEELKVLFRGF